jgi:regulator of ribonuclease activity A
LYDRFLEHAKIPTTIHQWQSYGSVPRFCGYAVTVQCYEDNSRIQELLEPATATATTTAVGPKKEDESADSHCPSRPEEDVEVEVEEERQQKTKKKQHVLVVDGGGSMRCALLGDRLAAAAATAAASSSSSDYYSEYHWAGLVIYGCVRDVDVLRTIPNLGIVALGCTPRKSIRRGQGQINVPVVIGNVLVQPGDAVYVDQDGVVFLDPSLVV